MRRDLTRTDLPALIALVATIEEQDGVSIRTLGSELADYFSSGLETRTLGVFEDGELVAYGVVRGSVESGPLRCSGGVHPDHRLNGLGTGLSTWFTRAARDIAGEREARMEMHIDDGMVLVSDLAERAGFECLSGYVQMRRDLAIPRGEIEIPTYFHLESWTTIAGSDLERAYRDVIAAEGWAPDPDTFAPDWSFVFIDRRTDRSRLAAFLMSSRIAQEGIEEDVDEGYTEILVVLPDYRQLRLATSLLNVAADAYEEAGMAYAGLDVSTGPDGESPLVGLFGHLGYEPVRRTFIYSMPVPRD